MKQFKCLTGSSQETNILIMKLACRFNSIVWSNIDIGGAAKDFRSFDLTRS
jgi:hypothetical protein